MEEENDSDARQTDKLLFPQHQLAKQTYKDANAGNKGIVTTEEEVNYHSIEKRKQIYLELFKAFLEQKPEKMVEGNLEPPLQIESNIHDFFMALQEKGVDLESLDKAKEHRNILKALRVIKNEFTQSQIGHYQSVIQVIDDDTPPLYPVQWA